MVFKKRSSRRRFNFAAKSARRHSRRSSGLLGDTTGLLGAAAYGALRAPIAKAMDPISSKLPIVGSLADNIVMLGACMLGKKFVGNKVPMGQSIFKAGMLIEAAQIGQEIASGQAFGNTGSVSGYKF